MNISKLFDNEVIEHLKIVKILDATIKESFLCLCSVCKKSIKNGGKILLFGNGGSAADAQHIATEIVVHYKINKRRAFPAIALTTDTSILTATANDFSFDEIFSRQVEAIARPGDVVIGISTSGRSKNVLKALQSARSIGAISTGLTGHNGCDMIKYADPLIVVPSTVTARIQEMHILIGHMLCETIESDSI
ncbi:MAG: D-sedoheptulose 7-phosphate isomerase [Rhodospirillaceae bacterium]|nr:D-sedoheptulose 7-phosphate isomerase [Rhodospirillaceae bacterium]